MIDPTNYETQPAQVYNAPRAQKILNKQAKQRAEQQRKQAEQEAWHKAHGRSGARFNHPEGEKYRVPIQPPAPAPVETSNTTLPVLSAGREQYVKALFQSFHDMNDQWERKKRAAEFGNELGLRSARETIELLHSAEAKQRWGRN